MQVKNQIPSDQSWNSDFFHIHVLIFNTDVSCNTKEYIKLLEWFYIEHERAWQGVNIIKK